MEFIRAIFFDAVGTLIHPEPAAARVYADIGGRFGSRYSQATISKRFSQAFQKQETLDRQLGWLTSEHRELERWRDIVAEVLDDVTDPEQVFNLLYGHFADPAAWRCEPALETLLTELLERGYQLGLASNFDTRLHGLVHGLKPLHPFGEPRGVSPPVVLVSSEVGYRKPAPEFFAAMCQLSGLEPANILYVGDDPENDYDGARAVGMQAVLYDSHEKNKNWVGERILSLAEVKSYV